MLRLLLILGNGWADCAEIWYTIGVPLVIVYAVITVGVSLHVRTCTPRFCISETAWLIVFKVGVWGGGHYRSAFHKSWVGVHPHVRMCAPIVPYLKNRLTDCAWNWMFGLRSNSDEVCKSRRWGDCTVHIRTCVSSSVVSETAEPYPGGAPKQAYLFHARSFIAKHGILLVAWIKPRCQCLRPEIENNWRVVN